MACYGVPIRDWKVPRVPRRTAVYRPICCQNCCQFLLPESRKDDASKGNATVSQRWHPCDWGRDSGEYYCSQCRVRAFYSPTPREGVRAPAVHRVCVGHQRLVMEAEGATNVGGPS
jgi:hypothetical protein